MSKETVSFACRECEHKVDPTSLLSRHPPACECGRHTYPHSHRGRAMSGPEVIRHVCAFCARDLEFDKSRRWADRVDATSFTVIARGRMHRKRTEKEIVRRAFARVREHKMTPEGRVAMRIASFIRELAQNAKQSEEAGEPQFEPWSALLEDIASRIDDGQGWV